MPVLPGPGHESSAMFTIGGKRAAKWCLDLDADTAGFPAHDSAVIGDGIAFGPGKVAEFDGVAGGEGKVGEDEKAAVADIQHDAGVGFVFYREDHFLVTGKPAVLSFFNHFPSFSIHVALPRDDILRAILREPCHKSNLLKSQQREYGQIEKCPFLCAMMPLKLCNASHPNAFVR